MISNFKDSLPEELVNPRYGALRPCREEWFDELPSTIQKLEEKWLLEVHKPFPGVEFNFVAHGDR
jgi:hypothetical protein